VAVRWAFNARADLERIWHFHADRDPDRADAVVAIIEDRADAQAARPYTARIGDIPGTREYLLRDLQYLLIYTIDDDGIFVVRVLSTRERP